MGRPEDEFVRKHAEKSENGWKCKYCSREFKKTSVSRMRVHLSRVGDANISGCEDVPNEIADEALGKINKKRARKSCEGEVNDGVIVGNSKGKNKDPLTQRAHEEHVTDALVKFFVYKKATVSASDFMDDPNLKEFLKRVDQYGVPPSLLKGETLVVEKSLLNIRDVVSKYTSEVMESWKTTGCTLIGFNSKDMKVKSSVREKDEFFVLGFYSPKGFIFFEGPDITRYDDVSDLKAYLPTLDIDDVTVHFMSHLCVWDCEGRVFTCEFINVDISCEITGISGYTTKCVCNTMQDICIDVCKKSEWAQRPMKTVESMHHYLAEKSLRYRMDYYEALKKIYFKGFTNIVRFLAFMTFARDKLEEFISYHTRVSFLEYPDFWSDAERLNRVLCYFFKTIPNMMDTLAPTAGYCWQVIRYVHFQLPKDIRDDEFKEALKSKLRDKYACLYTAAFLNPDYLKRVDEGERLNLIEAVKQDWFKLYRLNRTEEFAHEVERYNSEIDKPESLVFYEEKHPVKWWEEKGDAYPLLHKYAIQVLSRPLSCMCNQVKKHIVDLEGAEDYILRLNVRMMEEYTSLGDNIYKPIDLVKSWYSHYFLFPNTP